MRAARVTIRHFRGIKEATILLPRHAVLIGDNNTGKTTILEALDLALGPDRLNRFPPVDEHDFFEGNYLEESISDDEQNEAAEPNEKVATEGASPSTNDENAEHESEESLPSEVAQSNRIDIEVVVTELSEEQRARFGDYIEFWDTQGDGFYDEAGPEGIDAKNIEEALRVSFHGWYDEEEDDFQGKTYFTRSLFESSTPAEFRKKDKQLCGFLYLRSLRTGSRALSLQRGSLLDIILRIKEVRPKMWEETIEELSHFTVASDPEIGISGILESINSALEKYVPKEWGVKPHLKVSNLTREHLRKVITAFIATGDGNHAAPYYRQGTGTTNMLVLAMLSQIAEDKQNVIFAMEEPETAIPPYAQKRIIHEVRALASQAIFTSHSPYVLEEFDLEETVVLSRGGSGRLRQHTIELPKSLKVKAYLQEFRTRFCEGLLARRVLICEGDTEATAFPVACRRLSELDPEKYKSLEALGICTVNAGSDSRIASLADLFNGLGKQTFGLCDKQGDDDKAAIQESVDLLLMHEEKGFENLILKGTSADALERYLAELSLPQHLADKYPDPASDPKDVLFDYFSWSKGDWGVADFIAECAEEEIPEWLRSSCQELIELCMPAESSAPEAPDLSPEAADSGND